MSGLECVEVKYSILNSIIDSRIESEYFLKKFTTLDNKLSQIKTEKFILVTKVVNGRAYNSNFFNDSKGIRLSKIGDVTNKRFIQEWEYVTEDEFNNKNGKLLMHGDILMSLTGDPPDIGKVNYIFKPENASWNQRVANIKLKNTKCILSQEVLYVLLSSKYCRLQLERYAKGIRQRNLGVESLKKLILPIFSFKFQSIINELCNKSYLILENSRNLYSKSERLLFEELDLLDFKPSTENIAIKRLKESYLKTGRLDSEYYQIKYDEIENKIKNYSNGYETINNILLSVDTGEYSKEYFNKKDKDNLVFYIRSTDINNGQIIENEDFYVDKRNFKKVAQKGDILTSRVGSVGVFGEVDEKIAGSIYSDNIIRFRMMEKLNPSVYTLLFNTKIYFELIDKMSRGSVQQRLNQETLKDLIVPVLTSEIQDEIQGYIKKSIEYKNKAKILLENAVKSVEIAIDKGEETAENYLAEQSRAEQSRAEQSRAEQSRADNIMKKKQYILLDLRHLEFMKNLVCLIS